MQTLFRLAIVAFILVVLPAQVQAAPLSVPLNRAEVVTFNESIKNVDIGSRSVARVIKHNSRKVSIIGKGMGQTFVRFVGSSGRLIGDFDVTVTPDLPELRKVINRLFPQERVGVERIGNSVAVTGAVRDAEVASHIIKLAEQYASRQGNAEVLNMMRVTGGQQVMLRVRIGEIQRGSLNQLGFSVDGVKGLFASTSMYGLSTKLDALAHDGLLRVLAEPNLTAISGEKAEFLAGGEFPVPVQNDDGVSVSFKEFGVRMHFTPHVFAENRIRLEVEPEVSSLSKAGAVKSNGFDIPALTTRRAKTTVELAPGESFMIAGLIQDDLRTVVSEVPAFGEIPVLSALFRSSAFQRNETELVIAVTPYLVDPVKPEDIKFPTDDYRAPSVYESYFFGALGSLSDKEYVPQNPSSIPGKVEGWHGFMTE